MSAKLSGFFKPKGVALIGASSNPEKLGYGILSNMIDYHYDGKVYPVNPKDDEILGLKCYKDVIDVPDPVELAVIIIPVKLIAAALKKCGQRGIKNDIIISGGFKEVGEDGAKLEEELLQIARQYDIRFIGPNCVGTMDLYSGLNSTFIDGMPQKGGIGFMSQSGAVCGAVVNLFKDKGVGFSYFVSLGNEADVNETDVIEYFGQDKNTSVIAAYVEAIQDGRRFLDVAKDVSRHKPIVIIKSGRSDAGAKAVSSHTGSLAGTYTAYQAAFMQAGVIEVETISQLFNMAAVLDTQSIPVGDKVAIVTNSGGPAALASDSLADNGLSLATLSEDSTRKMKKFLNPSAQVSNPIDMLGGATPEEYNKVLNILSEDEKVDTIFTIYVPTSLVDPADVAAAISEQSNNTDKPIFTCFIADEALTETRKTLFDNKLPMIVYPDEIGAMLGGMKKYNRWLDREQKASEILIDIDVDSARAKLESLRPGYKTLGEADTRPILKAYGIPVVSGILAKDQDEAVVNAKELGFPVALKLISADVFHKSDAGGVVLNLRDENEIRHACVSVKDQVLKKVPGADIEGFLIEKMAKDGIDVIIGMKRDPNFGPLMMFGMGGIYVELFKDIAFGVAPITRDDVLDMINNTKAAKLLKGYRGSPPADIDSINDSVLRLAQLALDIPKIKEIEINPLRVFNKGQGSCALDARILLE